MRKHRQRAQHRRRDQSQNFDPLAFHGSNKEPGIIWNVEQDGRCQTGNILLVYYTSDDMEESVRQHQKAEPGYGERQREGRAGEPFNSDNNHRDNQSRDIYLPKECGSYPACDMSVEPFDEPGRLFQEMTNEDEWR